MLALTIEKVLGNLHKKAVQNAINALDAREEKRMKKRKQMSEKYDAALTQVADLGFIVYDAYKQSVSKLDDEEMRLTLEYNRLTNLQDDINKNQEDFRD